MEILLLILLFIIIFIIVFIFINSNKKKYPQSDKSLFLYSVPWCGHCKAFEPIWNELINKFPNINFKKINCDSTSCPNIDGFPTIILDNNGTKINYTGNRTLEDLSKFLS